MKKKNKLDEMQEQKLLRIEHNGCWFAFWALIAAMLAGRAVWGVAEVVLLGLRGNAFTWQAFAAGAFINAIPGIILQCVLIPAIMVALHRARLVPFRQKNNPPISHEEG